VAAYAATTTFVGCVMIRVQ